MKRFLAFIIISVLTVGAIAFCVWFMIDKEKKEYSLLIMTSVLFIFLFYLHWLISGRGGFITWFIYNKGYITFIFFVFCISMLVGSLFGEVFYTALLLIVPIVIGIGIANYIKEKKVASNYFNELDYEEIACCEINRKCNKCGSYVLKVFYKNPIGQKKIAYKCDCNDGNHNKNN